MLEPGVRNTHPPRSLLPSKREAAHNIRAYQCRSLLLCTLESVQTQSIPIWDGSKSPSDSGPRQDSENEMPHFFVPHCSRLSAFLGAIFMGQLAQKRPGCRLLLPITRMAVITCTSIEYIQEDLTEWGCGHRGLSVVTTPAFAGCIIP